MWKWSWLIILVLLLSLMPVGVSADSSASVTITAVGYICEAPGGFVVTYISDYEVGLSWAKGVDAENTMVRACIGRFPVNREDGYLVYYGDGTSAMDWVNMEFLSVPIYYQAWSQRADGVWEEGGSEPGWVEGITIMLFALVGLSLILTGLAFVLKRGSLYFGGATSWAILGAFCLSKMTGTTDIYFYLFLMCMGMTLVCIMAALTSRARGISGEPLEDNDAKEFWEGQEETERGVGTYNYRNQRSPNRGSQNKRRPPKRLSF